MQHENALVFDNFIRVIANRGYLRFESDVNFFPLLYFLLVNHPIINEIYLAELALKKIDNSILNAMYFHFENTGDNGWERSFFKHVTLKVSHRVPFYTWISGLSEILK